MDQDITFLEKLIGHDGSEIVADIPSPGNHRGFSIQEIIDTAIILGYAVAPIYYHPQQTPDGDIIIETFANWLQRFNWYLAKFDGIIIGSTGGRYYHAVAWDHKDFNIYDPRGYIYRYADIKIEIDVFWIFQKIKINLEKT